MPSAIHIVVLAGIGLALFVPRAQAQHEASVPVLPDAWTSSPPAPIPAAVLRVLLDDRPIQDQASDALLNRVAQELNRRRGVRAVRWSEVRAGVDAQTTQMLARCGDDPGCLAVAAVRLGVDEVLTVRVTRRDAASFVALTRINALRPQIAENAASLVATAADTLAFAADGVEELWPGVELLP